MTRNPSSQDTDDELPTLMASNITLRLGEQVPGATVTRLPDNLDRTFHALYASSVPSSSLSPSTRPRVPVATYASPHASTPTQHSPRGWCGNLAQGHGLVTLTSQAPVTSGPRTKLRASRTIEIIACSWETVVFHEQLRA
jgi:hypothetical protein